MNNQRRKTPVLFVGHGSPMNAVENNEFTLAWSELAQAIGRPKAILCISAHWFVADSLVLKVDNPRTIHDFYGFPGELYQVSYPAPGAARLADSVRELVKAENVTGDDSWGLDHGAWVVIINMFPDADIPVTQLSVNFTIPGRTHYQIGKELAPLRDEGVLIIGSGNIVHNLGAIDWDMPDDGFTWANSFDSLSKRLIQNREDKLLINHERLGREALLSIPTPDHYWPLLYVLGAADPGEPVNIFNDKCVYGSVSMTAAVFGL